MQNESIRPTNGHEFLTVKDAAKILRVSDRMMYRLAKKSVKKNGPPIKRWGRNCIRFPRKPFLKWAGLAEG